MAAERRRFSFADSAGVENRSACRSRLRRPLMVNSPRLTASSNAMSSAAQGRKARTLFPFQVVDWARPSVNSFTVALSSTQASAVK